MNKSHTWLKVTLRLTVCISAFCTSDSSSAASALRPAPPPALSSVDLEVWSSDATAVTLHWTPVADATEYTVSRDDMIIGSSVAQVGYFTDFGLRPGTAYRYAVAAHGAAGVSMAQSQTIFARTARATKIRTRFTVLAIAFTGDEESIDTEATYFKHRVQFLSVASLGSATIVPYKNGIVSSMTIPRLQSGSTQVDYRDLVTRRDLQGLDGYSIVDLIERGDIDHVWVVKLPAGVDFAENVLVGNRAIQGEGVVTAHSWPPLPVPCSRSFFVNAYSPDERSWDAYVHMVEGIMTSISDGHPASWPREFAYTVYADHLNRTNEAIEHRYLNAWERFRLTDGWNGGSPVAYASEGNANVGSSHFLPTTPRTGGYDDYTYFDYSGPAWHRYVDSAADDWLSYPVLPNDTRKINGYEFGAFHHYREHDAAYSLVRNAATESHSSYTAASTSFHQWWFAHLPNNPGVTNGALNTWWPHLFDFNRFDGSLIDYPVWGFPRRPPDSDSVRSEYGTERATAEQWGYWHSQNGFSPGGRAATLSVVKRRNESQAVKAGRYALDVRIESSQDWEWLGVGRHDLFYPVSRNAHWHRPNLAEIEFSIKPQQSPELLVGTNPIVRLHKNRGTRIELVPLDLGVYTNLLQDLSYRDADGWYNFQVPLAGDARWEKNVIGYLDPALSGDALAAAKAALERDILSDLNYIEISIQSSIPDGAPPGYTLSFYLDGMRLIDRE